MFDSLVAVYPTHLQAELAVRKLADNHFDMKHLSIVGRGYPTEEQVTGFYNTGDRVQFWGTRGAFWGGLWGLFFGGMFLTVPVIGQVMVLGYLVSVVVATIEGAVVVGGLSAIGAALFGIGIPRDSVIQYEVALMADSFLVTVHANLADLSRARHLLETTGATGIETHALPEIKAVA